MLFARLKMAPQAHGNPKGPSFTEAKQGLKTPTQHPSLTGQQSKLVAQSQFPACRMHPCSRAKAANCSSTVVARWRAPIRTSQQQHPLEPQGLQNGLN
jgi:hypothetical protein